MWTRLLRVAVLLLAIGLWAPPAHAQIAFRSGAKSAWATQASVTVTRPTGTVDGDLLYAYISAENVPTISTPSGWQADASFVNGAVFRCAVFTKVANGEGAGGWTWTLGASTWSGGIVLAASGGATTSWVDAVGAGSTGSASLMTAASISPTESTDLLVYGATDFATSAHTAPTGMSSDTNLSNGESVVYYQVLSSSGATGTREPGTNATGTWGAVLIALKAAAGGGGAPPKKLLLLGVGGEVAMLVPVLPEAAPLGRREGSL